MSPIPGLEPENDLMDAYQRWRQLTEVENLAICAEDWPRVDECQEAKRNLQPVILQFTTQALATTADRSGFHRRVRTVVQELVSLEHHNNLIISQKREKTQCRLAELNRSAQSLRRVHRSYTQVAHTNWQSYS